MGKEENKIIGERIRSFRKKKEITQKKLAEMTGLAEITIRQYEAGQYKPKVENMIKISNALGIAIGTLASGNLSFTDNEKEALKKQAEKELGEHIVPALFELLEQDSFLKSIEVVEHFERLNDNNQIKALDYMDYLYDRQDSAPDPDHQDTE